jgi:hypothetical protein
VSLVGSNTNHAVTNTTYWTPWTNPGRSKGSYGQTAGGSPIPLTYPGTPTVYLSLYSSNSDNPVSATGNWLALTGTVAPLQVRYPLGAGPLHDTNTANAYHLPYGFLRRAITDPKAGQTAYLGANSGSAPEDWTPEDQYFVSKDSGPLMMRFIGNVLDVSEMDVLFCEALGAAIAMEITEPVLQDVQKYQKAAGGYKLAISRARAANMIESGPVTMTESKYLTVRA